MKLVMFKEMITLTLDVELARSGYTQAEIDAVVAEIVEKFGFDHGYIDGDKHD